MKTRETILGTIGDEVSVAVERILERRYPAWRKKKKARGLLRAVVEQCARQAVTNFHPKQSRKNCNCILCQIRRR